MYPIRWGSAPSAMGVHRLNQLLQSKGESHIREVRLKELGGRTVAVDASIYMYKFLGDRALLAGIYQMVVLFRRAGADLVFVFDGQPPPEKMAAQAERSRRKEEAYEARCKLEAQLSSNEVRGREARAELAQLKRKSLRLGRVRVDQVRRLLDQCGVSHISASGEADHACAQLVIGGRCWACLSEDTDMFPLGCPRVLRYLNLMQGKCTLYDWEAMRRGLSIGQDEFRLLCAAAGSDYGPGVPGLDVSGAWDTWEAWVQAGRDRCLGEALAGPGGQAAHEEMRSAAAALVVQPRAPDVPEPCPGGRRHARRYLEGFGFVFP